MEEKKNLLTYAGLKKLEEELHDLKVVKRKEVAGKIKEAREHRRQREHRGRALKRAVRAAPALAHARQKQRAHPPDADGVCHHEAVHGKPRPRALARGHSARRLVSTFL